MFRNVAVKNNATQSSRIGTRVLLIGIAILTLSQSTGCKLGIKDAAMLTYRDEVWSRRAYNLRYGSCAREYSEHFQNGFRAGYRDTSNGGDGYVPALPPESYRAAEYQSADGAKCVNSWFEGYPAGVAAAKKDKSGTYHDILISRMINSAVSQSKTKPELPGDARYADRRFDTQPNVKRPVPVIRPPSTVPVVQPPSKSQYVPLNVDESTFAPSTFDAPPQASAKPAETPQADAVETPAMPAAAVATLDPSSQTAPATSGEILAVEESSPTETTENSGDVAPASFTETSK